VANADADRSTARGEGGQRFGGSLQRAFVTLTDMLGEVMNVARGIDTILAG
jgi:hypothetical protein